MLTPLIVIFVLGYLAIALEHQIHVNKAASALFIGVVCWTLYVLDVDHLMRDIPSWFSEEASHEGVTNVARHYLVDGQLLHATGEIAQILFFLMGAMTIVELVDAHEGFAVVTSRIRAKKRVSLLWIIGWLTFFLSSVLDNLTTTIVMISLLRKLVHERELRMMYAGVVVIAANAGGAWTVIGDVTTTMLWIKGKIGTVEVMYELFLPSIVCLLVPLIGLSMVMKGELPPIGHVKEKHDKTLKPWHQVLFLVLGLAGLLSVPVFKAYTHCHHSWAFYWH